MATSGGGKRRKVSLAGALSISDIPDGFLAEVGSYLAAPSRALFALAFAAPTSQTAASTATTSILAPCKWEVLDFADIEKSLASKLTDDDIRDVLVLINAANHLKRLELAGCVSITGRGLEPLRGSTVIEQIDLSLVGPHERPDVVPEPKIHAATTISVLRSIIAADGNSLRHLQLPKKFFGRGRDEYSRIIGIVNDFLTDYDRSLARHQFDCVKCKCAISQGQPEAPRMILRRTTHASSRYGLQDNTCCMCIKGVCERRSCRVYNDDGYLKEGVELCRRCERFYCSNCVGARKACSGCHNYFCKDCEDLVDCLKCMSGDLFCQDCINYDDEGEQMGCAWCEGNGWNELE